MNVDGSPLIRFEEQPEYGRLASRLAHFLYYFYERQNKKIPSILVIYLRTMYCLKFVKSDSNNFFM
jgi:hypothetical protein